VTRTAIWRGPLGFVEPDDAGCDDEHSLREPLSCVYQLPPLLTGRAPSDWREPYSHYPRTWPVRGRGIFVIDASDAPVST
jgi:hypothetical protein